MRIDNFYGALYSLTLAALIAMAVACFIRALRGPSIADRVVAVNMIGTQVIIMCAVVALLIGEGYLTDVAMLYAMISFLAVVSLCKVYMGVYLERLARRKEAGNA
ncbi:MAG TPA: monovalent cation/H+ antiporter complex subunit F [Candidatus Limnocylindria bacterium]|nr:monovalent cation/H+ antiporter complex subunit F [Candidatus Limnocylindria bacterium]